MSITTNLNLPTTHTTHSFSPDSGSTLDILTTNKYVDSRPWEYCPK